MLAQWIRCEVCIAQLAPCMIVNFVLLWIALAIKLLPCLMIARMMLCGSNWHVLDRPAFAAFATCLSSRPNDATCSHELCETPDPQSRCRCRSERKCCCIAG